MNRTKIALSLGVCMGGLMFPAALYAQSTGSSGADEIVVTATRQSQAISRVPISVTALAQESLDNQGIRNIDDVMRFTPGLTLSRNGFGTQATVSIRGISSNVGAGTVGVYVDDTPIQTRAFGYTSTNAYPRLFDLERLEVLRGPQGTLFGAGSMGGTIRFITPDPDLSKTTAYGRSEVGLINGGATNYELGAAVGGPLIEDKLGFRASVSYRRDGGWIDRVDQFTGAVLDKNANKQDSIVARAALTLAATENFKITPSIIYQDTRLRDTYTFWDTISSDRPDPANPANSDPANSEYRNGQRLRQPDNDRYMLPALKLEYNGDGFDVISNTSYFKRTHIAKNDYTNLMAGLYVDDNTVPGFPDYEAWANMQNKYKSFAQEIRIQSNDSTSRFTWVVGGFYNKLTQNGDQTISDPQMARLFQVAYGNPNMTVFDETGMDLIDGQYSFVADFNTVDKQLAAFGEVTYELFDGFKAIAGLRYSRSRYSSTNFVSGPFNYGTVADFGKGGENPLTPKFGLSWQIDSANMVYATVAKGFRVGGANPVIPVQPCQTDLDNRGYSNGAPTSYGADSLWSYEVGSKNRLFGGATQIAASAFYVKWNNIQRNVYLGGCALQFTDNLGVAVSKGFDISVTQRVFDGFTVNVQASYTNSTFDKDIYGRLDRLPQVRKGNALQNQPWTVVVGAEYRTPVGSNNNEAYARVDYNYRGGQMLTSNRDPLTSSFNPVNFDPDPTNNFNVRVGTQMGPLDLSVFATNLFNDHPALTRYAEGGDPVFRQTTVTPRTIGVTAAFRY